jgi:hypothetical protein
MNRIGLAVLALLFTASSYAQQIEAVDPDTTSATPQDKVEPASALEPTVPQLVMDRARSHNDADARQCLQLTTNTHIHRCAEKYRSHGGQVMKASQTKTMAAGSNPPETTKPREPLSVADIAKGAPAAAKSVAASVK